MRNLIFLIVVLAGTALAIWFDLNPRVRPIREGLDLKGGVRFVVEVDKEKHPQPLAAGQIEQVRDILDYRLSPLGLAGTDVRIKGGDQVEILLPGARDPVRVERDLIKTAQLEIRYLKNVQSERNPTAPYKMEVVKEGGREVYRFVDAQGNEVPQAQVIAESPKILTGAALEPKSAQDTDYTTGEIIVRFQLREEGRKVFADATTRHRGEYLAIVLDSEIISAPIVRSPITGGQGRIEGGFATVEEARRLAVLLNSGALPVPLRVVERQEIGATLGAEAVQKSIAAGLLGLGIVLAFMLIYYALPGLLANIALLCYAALTFAIYKLLRMTMDLPGITGFILSVGMAVDANILIFERLKEELRAGKPMHAAIDAGFKRAFSSILDSNVSTWITCLILYQLGAPMLKGFALTLAIGVAVSMFTAINVTRTLLHVVVNWPWARNERVYGLGISWLRLVGWREDRPLPIMGRRRLYLGISLVLVLISIGLLVKPGLRLGIDFEGGSQLQVTYRQPVADAELRSRIEEVLARHQVRDARVLIGRTSQTWTHVTGTGGEAADSDIEMIRNRLNALTGAESVEVTKQGQTMRIDAVFVREYRRDDILAALRGINVPNLNFEVRQEPHAQMPVALILTKRATSSETLNAIRADLAALPYGLVTSATSLTMIGPSVAKDLVQRAVLCVVLASVALLLYLGWRFALGGLRHGLKFGGAAILTLLHDVLFAMGLFAVMGQVLGWQIDSYFVTAALTVIGYSVHDTIVVFDRIRENLRDPQPRETLEQLVDRSITTTFDRSLNTSLTVMFVLIALIVLGGESIRPFNAALLAGIGVGTYSSIFVASPLVVMWERAARRAAEEARKREDVRLQTTRAARIEEKKRPVATPAPAVSGEAPAAGSAERPTPPKPATPKSTAIRPKRKRRL